MKRLIALLLLASLPGAASQTIVQAFSPATTACGGAATTCTFSPSATGAGHMLVAYLWYTAGDTITSPTGWIADSGTLASGGGLVTQFFYYPNAPSTSSVVFTDSVAGNFACGYFYEISSSSGPGWPVRDTSGELYGTTNSATYAGPTLTLNGNDDVIIQAVTAYPRTITSAGSGYTAVTRGCTWTNSTETAYIANVSTDGAMTWTAGSASSSWLLSAEAFCDNGSGGCTPHGFPQILQFFDRRIQTYLANFLLPWAIRQVNGRDGWR